VKHSEFIAKRVGQKADGGAEAPALRGRIGKVCGILLLLISPAASQTPTCATCHAKIAQAYAKTGMARSFYKPKSIQPTRFYHKLSDTWYAMEERSGQYYQRRWRIGYDGKETEVQEQHIDYVMGSGNHVRTYLTRTERGALIELPLAWYSENGGTWAMNPGHDRDYALPPRAVAYECMFCHNSYPEIPLGHEEPGSEPLYTGELPQGIDCQRCHGSGADHVRMAQTAGAKVEDIRKAIVNPARLSRDRQLEVCMQCHLETTSLQLPHSIVKYGRSPFSYRPGEPLGSFMLFFDHAPGTKYKDDFEIAHSAYRLRKSKCFLGSQMTCLTCHDPHDVPRGAEARAHYNGVCGNCHQSLAAQHPKATDCVACHMPKRRTQDVIQAVMTDHYIQRRPPAGDLLAPLSERAEFDRKQYTGEVVPYSPVPLPATPENALYLAVAQVTQKSNLKAGLPRLAAEIEKQKPARPEFYVELGEGYLTAHNPRAAVSVLDEALRREPNSPVALLDLASALTEAGDTKRATEILNRGVKAVPNDPLLWYQLGLAGSDVAAVEKAVALDPGMADAYNLLGTLLADKGDFDRAMTAWRNALRVEPGMPDAQGNLAHLLAARRDLPQAEYYFARAIRLKPNDADMRVNYAVTLAGLNKFAEAQTQAEAAVRADSKSADAHNFLGSLLARKGEADSALHEFLEAVRLRPDFSLAHLNAAGILAAKGDTAAARSHLQKAAADSDPAIRQRAQQLLR
jgi:predicted CXXCH cytochrome family protein